MRRRGAAGRPARVAAGSVPPEGAAAPWGGSWTPPGRRSAAPGARPASSGGLRWSWPASCRQVSSAWSGPVPPRGARCRRRCLPDRRVSFRRAGDRQEEAFQSRAEEVRVAARRGGVAGVAGPGLTAASPPDPGQRRGDWERAAPRWGGGRSEEEEEGESRQVSAGPGRGAGSHPALLLLRGAPPPPSGFGLFFMVRDR